MKKTLVFGALLVAITAATFVSCSDDDNDSEKPVISNVDPIEGEILQIGNEHGVHLEMDLSDNEALASYKIDIHNNFDGHTHKASVDDSAAFAYTKSWTDIQGKKNAHIHHHEITIPSTVTVQGVEKPVRTGKYHFVIYCLDNAGNESVLSRNISLYYTDPSHDHDHEK